MIPIQLYLICKKCNQRIYVKRQIIINTVQHIHLIHRFLQDRLTNVFRLMRGSNIDKWNDST